MVKRKSRQLASEKNHISSCSTTLSGEDDWVIVKKQRITILIPPLHPREPAAVFADQCANTIQDVSVHTEKTKKQLLQTNPTDELKLAAGGKADNISPRPESSTQSPKKVPIKEPNLGNGKGHSLHIERIPHRRDKSVEELDHRRVLKRTRRLLIGATASFDGGVFLNQMMRASNLDKKILRAGGLSNWLASLGLHQFIKLFDRRKVDKFQLVNLTMKKLRDMGAIAVGPRRKLLHAIDCLCQPYCFESRCAAPVDGHQSFFTQTYID